MVGHRERVAGELDLALALVHVLGDAVRELRECAEQVLEVAAQPLAAAEQHEQPRRQLVGLELRDEVDLGRAGARREQPRDPQDVVLAEGDTYGDEAVAADALDRMEVDTFGLDEVDRKLLTTIIEKFGGGPVGLGTISASIHEEKDSIEEIIEPYLIQIGFLNRTPRGRMATRLAYEHFGLKPPSPAPLKPGLFDTE